MSLATRAERVYEVVCDLAGYTSWSGIVHRAEFVGPTAAGEPAWIVDLRAGVGPLTRSKRLRMVRVVDERPTRCVIERRELDGREHSMWRLSCEVTDRDERTDLTMHLHYGGRLWTGGVLERILDQEVTEAAQRLKTLLEARPTP